MQKSRINPLVTVGLALWLGLSMQGAALAHEGHEHGAALHGGKVAMTREYHFEVVFAKDGLKVYPRTHEDTPVEASRIAGTATFYHPNSPQPWFERKLTVTSASPGRGPAFFGTSIDLSKVPAAGARVEFRVEGLPVADEPVATFTVPFVFRSTGEPAIANKGELTIARATPADQAAINAQRVCVVSGEPLGSMGGPLKASRGGRSVLLCCQGCVKTLKADPDKFLGGASGS